MNMTHAKLTKHAFWINRLMTLTSKDVVDAVKWLYAIQLTSHISTKFPIEATKDPLPGHVVKSKALQSSSKIRPEIRAKRKIVRAQQRVVPLMRTW